MFWGKYEGDFKKITLIGTGILLLLLFVFFIVTVISTSKLASQIKLITEHPFTVTSDISDIKTNLALMRIHTERLQSYNEPEDVEKVKRALDDLYDNIDYLIGEVEKLYLGPQEDTKKLKETYAEIQQVQENLLEFAKKSSSTLNLIAKYEEDNIYYLYEQFEQNAEKILSYAHNTKRSIFVSAEQLSKTSFIWSIIIITAMVMGLLFFQFIVRKISRRLYNKNRQFEILSDTIDETFLIFGKQNKCDFVSGSAERVLGLKAEFLMENREAIYQYMNKDTAKQLYEEIRNGEKISWETLIEYRQPQSLEPHWLQARYYRIKEGEDTKIIVTLTDRTEDRKAQQALQDALVSAQNANDAKRDFLSRMSHEIRTPMNAIIGMTTIAAAYIDDKDRVEDCLRKVSYSSKHLLTLINDVLDMSRIESNRMKLNEEPFEIFQFLNTFVSIIYPQMQSKGIEFSEKTTGFTDHTTYVGDSFRLNQILLNLASNAIKFTPKEGKIQLEVACLFSRDKKSWLRFTISDTGIGMNEDALSRLYTPFEQADESIARKYGGTGLGMSIVQNLTMLMGGYIDVKSKVGEGTTFIIELPFEVSNTDLHTTQLGEIEALEVLVVDDDKDICEHTAILLEKMNIHAEWVLSGVKAIERVVSAQAKGNSFDVCFIDWKMPDMDGIETTRRIREKIGGETPIIIISAYDWAEIEEEARVAGANAFISKPLFQSSIYNVLVKVTNGVFGKPEVLPDNNNNVLMGKRILLAEDNELNREIAVTLLEMQGATVETAENGQEVVNYFINSEQGYFDVILMDVQMPVMDGCEATKQIRMCSHKDAKNIPIIALTANAFTEDISTVLSAGMNAHVSKPIDMTQLCSLLFRFLQNIKENDLEL